MPVPKEIREVERPTNSVVIAYGKNKDRFLVVARTGCRYDKGRRIPINGPTIGHIIDFKFVPMEQNTIQQVSKSGIEVKDWALPVLSDNVFSDIINDLTLFYAKEDAIRIYCIALLRVCYPGVADRYLQDRYDESFISELYPSVHLSKNTVSTFLCNLGKKFSSIIGFMRHRCDAVNIDHHLIIDGTLKTNDSSVNSLSNFSRKAKEKGRKDISILYAFDLEKMEPVCSMCYPGNMLDLTAYSDFVDKCNITRGVIIADKGFPSKSISEHLKKNKNLHFLNPLRRNLKIIREFEMLNFEQLLPGTSGKISCKKQKLPNGRFLYAYKDEEKAYHERITYKKIADRNDNFDYSFYSNKEKFFGTIVFESDIDLDLETVYNIYQKRWIIEIMIKYYKNTCDLSTTRVHDDYSVIGSEFCNFLATVLSYRLINTFTEAQLLNKHTYGEVIRRLDRVKKAKINNEWQFVKMNQNLESDLRLLSLLPAEVEPPKRKRGRPRKIGV